VALAAVACADWAAVRAGPAPTNEDQLPQAADFEVDFVRDVRPLFAMHCVVCHGAEK
jgi:mono/diheme cytochrome c family protein